MKLHGEFVDALNKAEAVMKERNKSQARLRNGQGMPYTLLMPSNPEVMPKPGAQPPARGVGAPCRISTCPPKAFRTRKEER